MRDLGLDCKFAHYVIGGKLINFKYQFVVVDEINMAASLTAALIYAFLEEEGVGEEDVPRHHARRENAFEVLTETEFKKLFRLNKTAAKEVVDALSVDLFRARQSRTVITVEHQVLIALHFYAVGGFLHNTASEPILSCSKGTVSHAVHNVTAALCRRLADKINFPHTREEKDLVKHAFHDVAGMPGCIGLIDCTEVPIHTPVEMDGDGSKPRVNADDYVSRIKGNEQHCALNVLIVCDHRKKIRFIDISPGSTGDSNIWKKSFLKQDANNLFDDGEWLLGDQEYPLEPWLITPVCKPSKSAAKAFNEAHKKTRTFVDQCIENLKNRFQCLKHMLNFTPEKCSEIVKACVILHNICIENNITLDNDNAEADCDQEEDKYENVSSSRQMGKSRDLNLLQQGRNVRKRLIAAFS